MKSISYADLRTVLKNMDKDGKLVILGDFNAQVGGSSDTCSCIGCHEMEKYFTHTHTHL